MFRISRWGKSSWFSSLHLAVLTMAAVIHPLSPAYGETPVERSPISLREAVRVALESHPGLRASRAEASAASASVVASRAPLLPRVSVAATATRGDDPVYVFGTKLRQERFTTSDFALDTLNTPPPIDNIASRAEASWTLFDSLAGWRSLELSRHLERAAGQNLRRTEQVVVLKVVEAYVGVLLAREMVETTGKALETARSFLESSRARADAGLGVPSDLLSAQVRCAQREQESVQARSDLFTARARLDVALGWSEGAQEYEPAERLEERDLPLPTLDESLTRASEARPDLAGARSRASADALGVSVARASFGPRLSAFASWEHDDSSLHGGEGGHHWLGGIDLRIDVFQGGERRARLAMRRAEMERADAAVQAAASGVRLDVESAYRSIESARSAIATSRAAAALAEESLRINKDRYDAGLSTITDLLAAEEALRRARSDQVMAVARRRIGDAALELAMGTLSLDSPVVTP